MNLGAIKTVDLGLLIELVGNLGDTYEIIDGIEDVPTNDPTDLYIQRGFTLGWSRDEMGEDPGYDEIVVSTFTEEDETEICVTFTLCSEGDVMDAINTVSKALLKVTA